MNGNSDRFFSVLGKISLVIGIIAGLFTLYHYLNPKEPKLYAQCFPLRIPNTPLETEFLKNTVDGEYQSYEHAFRYFLQCKIINEGDREASGVRLVIPEEILHAEGSSDIAEIEYKKNLVEIKSLRPETSIKLDIWIKGYSPSSWEQLQLNSREVSGKVDIGEVYYGFSASIAKFFLIATNDFPIFFSIVIGGILVLFLIRLINYNEED